MSATEPAPGVLAEDLADLEQPLAWDPLHCDSAPELQWSTSNCR